MATPSVVPIRKPKPVSRVGLAQPRDRELKYKRSIDRRARILDRLEMRAEIFDLAIKALKRRKDLALQRFEKMEESILAEMSGMRTSRLTGMDRILTAKPNPPRLVVVDESKIPDEYMRQPPIPEKEPDKNAMKALLVRASSDDPSEADTAAAAKLAGAVKLVQTVSLRRE